MKTIINFNKNFKLFILMLIIIISLLIEIHNNKIQIKTNQIKINTNTNRNNTYTTTNKINNYLKVKSIQKENNHNENFLSEVYAKYYLFEEKEKEKEKKNLIINLSYDKGFNKSSILISLASIVIGFLFIVIFASIFALFGK